MAIPLDNLQQGIRYSFDFPENGRITGNKVQGTFNEVRPPTRFQDAGPVYVFSDIILRHANGTISRSDPLAFRWNQMMNLAVVDTSQVDNLSNSFGRLRIGGKSRKSNRRNIKSKRRRNIKSKRRR
jgi:hypothetical protein